MPVAFVDLAQQCAPQITVETLAAIVSVESAFRPFAIRINSDHPLADPPRTRAEAIETATILIAEGVDIDLGLTGLPARDLPRLGLSVGDSFDFCMNLKASATLLDGYYRVAVGDGASAAEARVAMLRAWYGRGDASIGEMVGYDTKVLAEQSRLSGHLDRLEITVVAGEGSAAGQADLEGRNAAANSPQARPNEQGSSDAAPRWDVFGSGRRSSVLVFSNQHKE
ncbi:lytic transglycosylase domain-containing protein [Mesorhizobium sp. CAU 1732]|uniref:lytic transglycosylase domain-containing protein n=1 Tax=Mesorhizobium sp. CAU 1732 TaxID=3140358 RepID=UPI003260CC80